MIKSKYDIKLTKTQVIRLEGIINNPESRPREITRAQIILYSNRGANSPKSVPEIKELLNTTSTTINTVKREFNELGLDGAIFRKKRETPPVEPKITPDVEKKILMLARKKPPVGHRKWTLRLLAQTAEETGIIDSISHTAIANLLKKKGKTLAKDTKDVKDTKDIEHKNIESTEIEN